jgi:mono/diheme cytochrome c family protein
MNSGRSRTISIVIIVGSGMLVRAGAANGQSAPGMEAGNSLFQTYCASCHGPTARGDGPIAPFLKVPPANLAQIAKRNNGVFPSERVYQVVDGRQVLNTHGGSQMPVWGDAFSKSVKGSDVASVTARIKALVDYLASIQEKPANWMLVRPPTLAGSGTFDGSTGWPHLSFALGAASRVTGWRFSEARSRRPRHRGRRGRAEAVPPEARASG